MSKPDLNKIKILMLLGQDFLIPRIDPRVYKEAKTLQKNGYDVTIACLSVYSNRKIDIGKIKIRRLHDKANLTYYKSRPIFWLLPKLILDNTLNIFSLIKIARQINPQFIHAHDADTILAGTLAKLILFNRPRLIYDSHEIATEIKSYRHFRFFILLIEKFCSYFVDGFITVNEPVRQFITKRYPILKKHSLVLMNLPSLNDKYILKLNDPSPQLKFVFQGSVQSDRVKILEQIVILLNKFFKNWHLTLITKKNNIPSRSILYQNSNIIFKNLIVNQKSFFQTLNKFDVGIISLDNSYLNNYYSLPNKLFDYMMAGVVVLAPNFPNIAKIVNETQCGFLFSPNKTSSILKTLKYIFNNKKILESKKHNGQLWIAKKYNWNLEEVKLVSFYQKLLN